MHRLLTGLAAIIVSLAPGAALAQTPAYGAPPGGYSGPLYPAGEPVVAQAPVGKGQPIMTVPVRFSFTGMLQAPVTTQMLFAKPQTLPAGQPMFAMLYGASYGGRTSGPAVVWCGLHRNDNKKSVYLWTTVCLPGEPPRWVETYELLPFRLAWTDSAPFAPRVAVKDGPVDFGVPISFSYRLRQIDAKDMDIDMYLTVDGYDAWIGQTNPARQADGSALLPILGGVIRLVPDGKKTVRAEVIKPLSATSPDLLLPIK